ncbi:hypothetical protein JG687_00000977 [Phytophthora cactorum]|uniref:Uncharacterized protein n=1 Tax=Phytophthora cactorum TaxID=29920 RepID=A0A329T587_9STRA|nr:hypothetical protein GQ600_5388 [Phytophthora cactorum]KAG2778769.1 hypothetical protein Pcac1_g11051 [Phytophthora cactorum]KAG2840543.1 hypothetical protein PC111_g3441 [Phytophthora cactorum]KAG2849845.1 hypothetical protein PC112_g94 [Phytophthora cactorum]KAG2869275.1 hypothetical protein PC113_g346 [Phytophthora cactorum]
MEMVGKFLVYAKLVFLLAGRMVAELLRMGTSQLAKMTRRLVGISRVDLPNGDQQLLGTESVGNAVQKDLADEWVDVSDADNWEPGGKNLLDENRKPSHQISESSTEDELIELSDGEEPTTSLHSIKRDRAATKLTSPALILR